MIKVQATKKDGTVFMPCCDSLTEMPYTTIKVKLLTETAKPPDCGREDDGGIDVFADETVDIKPGETVKIKTGISLAIPHKRQVSLLWDRSGLGSKSIHRLAGVIDYGYRGEILVCLTNLNIYPVLLSILKPNNESPIINDLLILRSNLLNAMADNTYRINKGDKICQLLIQDYYKYPIEVVNDLDQTNRGDKGFGSSG